MTRPADVERIREIPVEWAFDFNRESDHVWAIVELGFGVSLIVSSDAPHSPRTWTAEEIDVPGVRMTSAVTLPVNDEIPYASELGRALAKAWDRYVSREARAAAVYTPGFSGPTDFREEAP